MKLFIPILLVALTASCKKEEVNPNLVREFSIQSALANANYKIKVALPENYDPASRKYATIYLLDGEENFSFVTENCKKISGDYSTENIIVVSIGYGNDRAFDYTPTKASEGGGGAEKFMLFLKDELIPRIENDFAADKLRSSRILFGHSFGGLFAAYAFTNFNDVFGNYLMCSPSLWYDNEILLRMEQENRNKNNKNQQLVFIGMGQLESGGRMLAPYVAFRQRLEKNYTAIKLSSHLVPQMDHMGSKNENILEGLKFYFQNN